MGNECDDDDQTDSESLKPSKQNKSSNICFTPSSKQQSEDESDDDVVIDLKWKSNKKGKKNQLNKKKSNILDDIERAKDLNRLEAQKLRQKLDEIYREKEELQNNFIEIKQEKERLFLELEKRPSYNEWTRLRTELNKMNK